MRIGYNTGNLSLEPVGRRGGYLTALTFHQLVQAGNLLEPINGVDCSHSLGQIHVIRQSSGQISQQGLERSEPVWGDGIHNPFEVSISVSIETNFLGLLLGAERLQRAGAVEAAVGAVSRARQAVHPRPSAVSLRLIPLVEVLQLHVSAEGHDGLQVVSTSPRNKSRHIYWCKFYIYIYVTTYIYYIYTHTYFFLNWGQGPALSPRLQWGGTHWSTHWSLTLLGYSDPPASVSQSSRDYYRLQVPAPHLVNFLCLSVFSSSDEGLVILSWLVLNPWPQVILPRPPTPLASQSFGMMLFWDHDFKASASEQLGGNIALTDDTFNMSYQVGQKEKGMWIHINTGSSARSQQKGPSPVETAY